MTKMARSAAVEISDESELENLVDVTTVRFSRAVDGNEIGELFRYLARKLPARIVCSQHERRDVAYGITMHDACVQLPPKNNITKIEGDIRLGRGKYPLVFQPFRCIAQPAVGGRTYFSGLEFILPPGHRPVDLDKDRIALMKGVKEVTGMYFAKYGTYVRLR